METEARCPSCHMIVRPTDYFCFNCGKSLLLKPLSISTGRQILIYLGSFLLPPLGLFWGWRYLRQGERKSKIVGLIAIILTVISLIITLQLAFGFINSYTSQLNQIQNFTP